MIVNVTIGGYVIRDKERRASAAEKVRERSAGVSIRFGKENCSGVVPLLGRWPWE